MALNVNSTFGMRKGNEVADDPARACLEAGSKKKAHQRMDT